MTSENHQASYRNAKCQLALPVELSILWINTYNTNVSSLTSPIAFASRKDHLV